MENIPNCKCIRCAGSIRHAGGSKPLQLSDLPPELRPYNEIIHDQINLEVHIEHATDLLFFGGIRRLLDDRPA